jgi:hypothetical protein
MLLKNSFPRVVETEKWGNITYLFDGRNLASLVCYRGHGDLGFFPSAGLKSSRLEGTGEGLHNVKVRSPGEVDEREFGRLLRDAAVPVRLTFNDRRFSCSEELNDCSAG